MIIRNLSAVDKDSGKMSDMRLYLTIIFNNSQKSVSLLVCFFVTQLLHHNQELNIQTWYTGTS